MQSALAITLFPSATVDVPSPGAEPTDRGFAMAFEADLPASEGDIAPSDATGVGTGVQPAWIGAAMSIPVVVQPAPRTGGAESDSASAPVSDGDLTGTGLSPTAAAFGTAGLQAVESGDTPGGTMPSGQAELASPMRAGPVGPDQTGTPSDRAFPPDPPEGAQPEKVPSGSWPDESPALRLPAQQTNAAVPETSVRAGQAGPGGTGDAVEVAAAPTSAVTGNTGAQTARIDPPVPEGLDRREPPQDARIARDAPTAESSGPYDRAMDPTAQVRPDEMDAYPSSGPESPRTPRRAVMQDDLGGPSVVAALLPSKEPLAAPTPSASSFWERAFAGLTAPQGSATGLQADRNADPDPVAIALRPATGATEPNVSLGTLANSIGQQIIDPPRRRSETVVSNEAPAKVSARAITVAPLSPSAAQTEQPALILLSEWDRGLLESREEPGFPVLAGPSLHSWSGAASVPQSPSSLPVQQVAAQLAGVLVETSDKATELALAPEELGRVRLRLEADAANPDRLVILISVERPETLDLFRRHAGDLAAAIKAAGYSGADIGFGQDGQGRSPDRRHEPNALGPGRSRDEQTPISPTRRDAVGATLDLRL